MTEANEVSPEAQEQLKAALDKAIDSPQQAQGFLSSIPDLSAAGGYKDKVVEILNTVLGAIDTVQQYQWILPGDIAPKVQKLEDALRKVLGWLD